MRAPGRAVVDAMHQGEERNNTSSQCDAQPTSEREASSYFALRVVDVLNHISYSGHVLCNGAAGKRY